ncbi:MAG: hypothetical protein FJX57_11010 [Alphaproteobacteria bacterium]|nr:hypothetical protein [Alphaproteobacteria bacterium]
MQDITGSSLAGMSQSPCVNEGGSVAVPGQLLQEWAGALVFRAHEDALRRPLLDDDALFHHHLAVGGASPERQRSASRRHGPLAGLSKLEDIAYDATLRLPRELAVK